MLSSICTLTKPSAHPCCESVSRPSGLRPVSTGRALTVNAGRSKSPAFSLRNRHRANTSFNARSIAARRRPAPLASSASSAPKPRSQSPSPICALVSAPSGSRRPCTSTCNDPRCRLASNLVHGDLDMPGIRVIVVDAVRVCECGVRGAEQPAPRPLRLAPRHGRPAGRLGERARQERGPSLGIVRLPLVFIIRL